MNEGKDKFADAKQETLSTDIDPADRAQQDLATWLRLVSIGALILAISDTARFGLSWAEKPAGFLKIAWVIHAGLGVLYVVGIWMLTSTSPINRAWLKRLRFFARFAVLVGLISLMIFPLFGSKAPTTISTFWWNVCFVFVAFTYAGRTAAAWYVVELSRKLGKDALTTAFLCVFVIYLFSLVLAIVLFASFEMGVREHIQRYFFGIRQSEWWPIFQLALRGVMVLSYAWIIFAHWWLWRAVRFAAINARTGNQSQPVLAVDSLADWKDQRTSRRMKNLILIALILAIVLAIVLAACWIGKHVHRIPM